MLQVIIMIHDSWWWVEAKCSGKNRVFFLIIVGPMKRAQVSRMFYSRSANHCGCSITHNHWWSLNVMSRHIADWMQFKRTSQNPRDDCCREILEILKIWNSDFFCQNNLDIHTLRPRPYSYRRTFPQPLDQPQQPQKTVDLSHPPGPTLCCSGPASAFPHFRFQSSVSLVHPVSCAIFACALSTPGAAGPGGRNH